MLMRLTFLIVALFGFAVARGQIGRAAAQIDTQVNTGAAQAGAPVELALKVTLGAGLHVQSNTPRDPAFIPTVLSFEPPAGVTIEAIEYPPSMDLAQAGLAQPLSVYGTEFAIRIRAALAAGVAPGELTIPGRLRYQACNDKACFPPVTVPVNWRLTVVSAGSGATPAAPAPTAAAAAPANAAGELVGTPRTIVAIVRSAMPEDFARAERMVEAYRAVRGVTPEMLLAKSWLGRGALAAGKWELAERHAQETYELGRAELQRRTMDAEDVFPIALGAAIEVLAQVAARQGRRAEGVEFLREQLSTYGGTSLHQRIQKNLNLLTLEGAPAPELDRSEPLDGAVPALAELKGNVVLLFFWAHWCSDCKAQGPVLQRLLRKYGSRGFRIVAPTQRYGYTLEGRSATPAEEERHIVEVRQQYYAWMTAVPVTMNAANHRRYGVSTTPTLAVVDRGGSVRLYRPGMVPEAELDGLIGRLLGE
jgi:thiol-disulfide isomerase/thioredoxin